MLGMHRSGTSSLSGTLVKLGVSPPKTLMQGRHDNPKGHWESEVLAAFHDELLASAGSRWDDWRPFRADWFETPLADAFKVRAKVLLSEEFGRSPVFVFKDPRVCRFARFWLEVFEEEGIEAKIVLPLRSPLEVAQSHRTRDGFPIQKGLLLWLRHVLDAEAASRDLPRGVFEWTALLKDWRAVALHLESSLGTRWPAMTDLSAIGVDRFLARDLKHESVSEAELATHPQLHAWVIEAYEALRELARNPASNSARATLDMVRDRFDDAARFFGGALAEIEVAYTEAEAMLRVEREAAARAAAELRQELDGVASREQQAQAALQALQEHHAAKAEEVERLTVLVDTTRAGAEMVQAAIRAEMTAALEAERQARAAEAEAREAAVLALVAERDAKMEEVARLTEVIEAMPAEVSRNEAALRQDYESILDSERQARAAGAAAYAASLAALEAERAAKAAEVASVSALLDATRVSAEEALAVVRRDLETLLDSEREARTADAAAHAASLESVASDRDAKGEEIERLSEQIRALTSAAAEEQARLRTEFEATLTLQREASAAEAEASRSAIEAVLAARDNWMHAAATSAEAQRDLQGKLADLKAEFDGQLAREQAAHMAAMEAASLYSHALEQSIHQIRASRSWRMTAPLRGISIVTRKVGRALARTAMAPVRTAVFLCNVAGAVTPRRVGTALKSVVTGQWGRLYEGVRWFGQGDRAAHDAMLLVNGQVAEQMADDLGLALPEFSNERNYWLPQGLRDYLLEVYGPTEMAQVSTIMDLVSAYGDTDGVIETSPELPVLLSWLQSTAAACALGDTPDVSIIIPVYNKLALTLTAIAAVLRCRSRFSFEILVADDCSTDGTAATVSAIGGCVRHIRSPQNLRFVLNCNHAAEHARGRILVFLNNDTVALRGWLDNLIQPLDAEPDVGMSGSKLLNGDGTLQEAGGIVWRDGSAWNYGRNQDPRLPEFNYRKEADYISGASIAVTAAVWRRLGGFDPHFAPAYCEDSDLAFRVRREGLKVIYAPHSEIIHHEGMSHGRDTNQGMKAYQVSNMQKFFVRWADILRAEHFPNGENVPLARDRSQRRPRILLVDHYVPEWDRDAGSRVMLDCIKFFLRCGFSVTFWPDNLNRSMPYTRALQDIGVEVVYGSRFVGAFEEWWGHHHQYYRYVLLSRPHIAASYIDVVNGVGETTTLYYGVDISWRRMLLEHAATGLPRLLLEAEIAKRVEDEVCSKSDYIIYLSREECNYARENFPRAKGIIEMPGWIFSGDQFRLAQSAVETIPENVSCRALFVGGFAHAPNGDGVRWFLDQVAPLVRAREPRFVTIVVGSHMPPDIIAKADAHVEVKGWASDDELAFLTREAACTIAPLRFGAGVKGKVISALASGSPVVSTSVGMQGLGVPGEIAFVGDTAEEFAEALIACLHDRSSAQARARRALAFVRERYSDAAMRAAFSPILEEVEHLGMYRPPQETE